MDKGVKKRINRSDDDFEEIESQNKIQKVLNQSDVHDFELQHTDSFLLTTLENALPVVNVDGVNDDLIDNDVVTLLDTTLTDIRNNNIKNSAKNLNTTKVTPKKSEDHGRLAPTEDLSRITKLDEILGSTYEGKGIFRYFNENKCLDELRRKKLTKLIIQFEINKSCTRLSLKGTDKLKEFIITSEQFLEYTDLIIFHFPTELTETYFIPSYTKNKKRILASGRLWDVYNNAKGRLKEEGLLEKKTAGETRSIQQTVVETDELNKKLQRLKAGITLELQDLLKLWLETFPARRAYLKDPCRSPFSYFQEFVHLQSDNGKFLIKSDFEQLYPKQNNLFLQRWPYVRDKLIQILSELKNLKGNDKNYLSLLPKLDSDHQTAIIFYLLPYLIPVGRRCKRNKASIQSLEEGIEKDEVSQGSHSKNTVAFRQNLFTIIVPKNKTIESKHRQLHQELKKKNETLQPTIFIKNNINDITSIKVYIDETSYSVDSYVEAVDLCFKLFFTLDCKYPLPIANIWNFIQKTFYDIDGEKLSPSLYGLCSDLKRLFPA